MDLTSEEKSIVNYEVIKGSGKSSEAFTKLMPKLAKAARVCVFITVRLGIYEIARAGNPEKEAIRQMAEIGGGVAGAAVGTSAGVAASGLSAFCGPLAPLCVAGIILIGMFGAGFIGQEVAPRAIDSRDDELEEFLDWEIF